MTQPPLFTYLTWTSQGKKKYLRKIPFDKFHLSNKHGLLLCRLCQCFQVMCIRLQLLAFLSILEKVSFQSTFPSLIHHHHYH